MFALLTDQLLNVEFWLQQPWLLVPLAFQIWMLVDAIRREEWVWAVFIFFFSIFSAALYYFLVYRQVQPAGPTRGFELPGAHNRHRIKELQAQIHHLDKPHHHLALGDIYFQQGKLKQAETSYRAAVERDPEDLDARAHLGQCLLRQNRASEARTLLENVATESPKHDYGHTLMAYAETLMTMGETDRAIEVWKAVNQNHSYARARVQLAELYLTKDDRDLARAEINEVLADDAHLPAFQRKRERVWMRKARALSRRLPKT